MDDIFLLKLALSFIVGGIWIGLATVLAEKFGTKFGGIFAGLPSMSAAALFFIAWSQTPAFASETTTIMPVAMGLNGLFVLVYSLLVRYSFWYSLIAALGLWFALSFGLALLKFDNFFVSLVGFVVLFVFSYSILEKKIRYQIGRKEGYELYGLATSIPRYFQRRNCRPCCPDGQS
jgi:hypothetical protein